MFTRKTLISCVLVMNALFASLAFADPMTLKGTLHGGGGKAKAFALVQLEGQRRYSAVTGIDGAFTITQFEPGTYLVHVRMKDDVETLTLTITSSPLSLDVKW